MNSSENADRPFVATRAVLAEAVATRACPGLALEVGDATQPLVSLQAGSLSDSPASPEVSPQTRYDLASLTKVIATASLAMAHLATGALDLDAPLGRYLPGWDEPLRGAIRIRHLLDHSSGLPSHARVWEHATGRAAYEAVLRALPLDRPPGDLAVYSDVGFMLLGFVLEDLGRASLREQFAQRAAECGWDGLGYGPIAGALEDVAPTEHDPWRGRLLVGEVHDANAAALGGAAGHAGLFGTAAAVGRFAALVLRTFHARTPLGSPEMLRAFARRSTVAGSSRALAWDTMLPTSSCGARLSPVSIGHTGFTGTSLWIDPVREVYIVLLSNRVHPTRANERFAPLRPRVHDAVIADLEAAGASLS